MGLQHSSTTALEPQPTLQRLHSESIEILLSYPGRRLVNSTIVYIDLKGEDKWVDLYKDGMITLRRRTFTGDLVPCLKEDEGE
jgi:hypothetical protein